MKKILILAILSCTFLLTSHKSANANESGVPLRGYADVGTSWIDPDDKTDAVGRGTGAFIGTLDFYLTPRINDNIVSLIEFAFAGNNGGVGFGLHRLQIGYEFNDMATIWLGRFHLPVGYYNTAYHHGAQIQTALIRPKFIEYEKNGAIFPMHDVGAWLTGRIRMGGDYLLYDLFLVNGNKHAGVHGQKTFSSNNSRRQRDDFAYGVNLSYSFDSSLEGLRIGASSYHENIEEENETWLNTGYILYMNHGIEFLNEFFKFDNKHKESDLTYPKSWAAYSQLAYDLDENWTPYYRFEKSRLDQTDPYFTHLKYTESYTRHALGLRYNFDHRSCLKFEFQDHDTQNGNGHDYKQALMQFAVGF